MDAELNRNMPVGDIVVKFPQTRVLLEALGIDYCCGGKVPLSQAAEQAGVPADKVLTEIAEAVGNTQKDAPSVKDWSGASSSDLVDHIEQTHHVFMKGQLPRIAGLLEKTLNAHGERHGEMLKALKHSYISLKTDIEMHLEKEEQILFPLIRQMEAFKQGRGPVPKMHCGSIGNPIRQMEHEHDVAGQFLGKMRQITGDYEPPDDACPTFMALLEGLYALERDLHEHIHLENNILFPGAEELEGQIS